MGLNSDASFRSHSLTEESGVGDGPIKPDRTGWFCHSLATVAPKDVWGKNPEAIPWYHLDFIGIYAYPSGGAKQQFWVLAAKERQYAGSTL